MINILEATQNGHTHNQTEADRHDCFQGAKPNFIAERSWEVTHHIGHTLAPVCQQGAQQRHIHAADNGDNRHVDFLRQPATADKRHNHTANHSQDNAEKRKVINKRNGLVHYFLASFFARSKISSRFRV